VVLGSTKEGRFADEQALADATVRHLSDDAPAAPSTGAAEPAAR
jgi:hypothetical protein